MNDGSVSPTGDVQETTRTEVYGAAAPDYFRAGWQPLPLPPGRKYAPPSGHTGTNGKLIGSIQTIKQWARTPRGAAGNIALHLLHPIIGIDVDTYGEKNGASSLAAAEAELGPLPPTLISSARPDPLVSGIRMFRLPDGCPRLDPKAEERLTSRFGADIDVISQAYRYVVAWPSANPEALDENGKSLVYRWYAQHGDGSIGHPLTGVPTFAEIAEFPAAWADLLAGPAEGDRGDADRAVSARAAVAEHAMADPFDPDDVELNKLGIDIANTAMRMFSREGANAEIEQWLTRLRTARRGRINDTLKDTASHLWHFVPHFLTPDVARALLVEAQRRAWIAAGGKDNGDYYQANRTIDHTVTSYVPAQIKFGLWWIAMPDEDDDGPMDSVGKVPASPVTTSSPVEANPEDDDPTEINDWDEPTPSASSNGAASAGKTSAASLAERLGPNDQADIDAMLALREKRRAEKREKAETEQLAQILTTERLRRKAKLILDEEEASRVADADAVAALMGEFVTAADLDETDPPEWLVGGDPNDENLKGRGLFYCETVARVIGAGGTYKTFLMLSIASCIARGIPWFGFATKAGPVVYVMAESKSGVAQRIHAFERHYGLMPTRDLHVITRPVQTVGPEWPAFVAACKQLGAALVVLDTQAKVTLGLDENAATDTGKWINAAERLRRETGACVVLVHHTGHDSGRGVTSRRGRGSSAAYAGIDTEILVEPDGERVLKYTVTRQKETERGETGRLQMIDSGDSITVALVDAEAVTPEERAKQVDTVLDLQALAADKRRDGVARVLASTFGGGLGGTRTELRKAYSAALVEAGVLPAGRLAPESTLYKVITEMEAAGWLLRPTPTAARFVLSPEGCKSIGAPFLPPVWAQGDEDDPDDDNGVAESIRRAEAALAGAGDDEGAIGGDAADDIEM
jgi:hypothetical protein